MLLFFFITAAAGEKYKPKFGHETTYTVALGMVISIVLWYVAGGPQGHESLSSSFTFKSNFFFDFMLPPLIFNSGYTMRKKKFFNNIGNIAMNGLCVTIVCFVLYGAGTIALVNMDILMVNYFDDNTKGTDSQTPIIMSSLQALLFAGLLCSSDVVAAVSIVDYEQQPKLFSCVFGEGVFNDIVSIILYNTVKGMLTKEMTAYTPIIILGEFIMLAVISLGVGLIFGFLTSFAFKHLSFLRQNPIIETFLMFAFSMISYFASNSIIIAGTQMSGITSLLTCGIVQSHYTYYNLSPQGKTASLFVVSFMGTTAEAAVYSYVGIALLNAIPEWWSFTFIFAQLAMIIVGRIIAVFGVFYAFRCCCASRSINIMELLFITYAGMIRGAIAFALVLTLPYQNESGTSCSDSTILPISKCFTYENYQMLVNTTLILVVLTTFIFGTFMGAVQKWLVSPSEEDEAEVARDHRAASHAQELALTRRAVSVYEEMQHPNEEDDHDEVDPGLLDKEGNTVGWTSFRFYKWFGDYDERTLRPFFIRNYNPDIIVLEDEYQEVLRMKFNEAEELADLAERVDVIKRTTSVANALGASRGRTQSRFMSMAARNMSYNARAMSSNNDMLGDSKNNRVTANLGGIDEDEEDDGLLKVPGAPQTREAAFSIQRNEN